MGRHRLCFVDAEQLACEVGIDDRRLLLSDAQRAAEAGMVGKDQSEKW